MASMLLIGFLGAAQVNEIPVSQHEVKGLVIVDQEYRDSKPVTEDAMAVLKATGTPTELMALDSTLRPTDIYRRSRNLSTAT